MLPGLTARKRVEAVTIAQVDGKNRPIPGTEERYECDTLLLSCGLIPPEAAPGSPWPG